ncbi:unnamed protein product, partial [Owenia fusiformis]
ANLTDTSCSRTDYGDKNVFSLECDFKSMVKIDRATLYPNSTDACTRTNQDCTLNITELAIRNCKHQQKCQLSLNSYAKQNKKTCCAPLICHNIAYQCVPGR